MKTRTIYLSLFLICSMSLTTVSATVPLFTGGQILNGNKLAEVNVEVTRLQRQQAEKEVRFTTEQYFWQIVMLKEKLQTLADIESQLKSIHKDVETAVDAGVTSRNDLLKVQLRRNLHHERFAGGANAVSAQSRPVCGVVCAV